jgi:MFS family permease
VVGTPLIVAGLVLLPFSPSTGLAGAAVLAFFVGYYLYYPPYRALYADLLPRTLYARAQAGQAIARGAGLGLALLAGGLLLGAWRPLVFLIAAGVVIATTLTLVPVFQVQAHCGNRTLPYVAASLRDVLLRDARLRMFAAVNALWEFSFAGLKSFIVLYVVKGLGNSARRCLRGDRRRRRRLCRGSADRRPARRPLRDRSYAPLG